MIGLRDSEGACSLGGRVTAYFKGVLTWMHRNSAPGWCKAKTSLSLKLLAKGVTSHCDLRWGGG